VNTVQVNRKAADRVASGHPWIFSSDIIDRGVAQAGDAVRVNGPRGKALGVAHYSSTSRIALRMLSDRVEPIGREFYLGRLRQAIAHRDRIVVGSSAFRVVSSEGDLLPGLIVDRYGEYLVMQTLDQGMDRDRDLIASCLDELISPLAMVARNDAGVRKLEDLPLETVVLKGEVPDSVPVTMNGLKLCADLLRGHKTGIYLDQRENYLAAARHAAPRGRVLDCFSSTGGFALHLAGKVEAVDAVESSTAAIETARANATRNGIENIQVHQADAFEFLSGAAGAGRRYDLIVLDPPAFAKSRRSLDDAARGYKDINLCALKLLGPGGVLVTCSCSHHMNEGIFLETVAAAALDAGRTLRVLERRTQAADHPILLTVPETLYLKCAILEVVTNSH
jgi:23S rRNA (cytosine1962-C5)-methyltransferase